MGAEIGISDWALASKIESTASVDNRLCIDSSLDQAKCDRWIGSQPVSEGSTKRRDLYNCSLPPLPPPHAFLRVGGMNPDNQIGILHSGQFRMQNSKPIPSGA